MTTTAEISAVRRFPAASPDGLIAAVLLSFLATAGLFYVNIMAALVSGLIDGLHFTEKQAGLVASANVYGAALGALVAVFLVKHMAWRKAAVAALIGMICFDLVSTQIASATLLTGVRFLHGTVGGFLVGTAFSVIARTRVPDRTFGMLLVVQFGLGGVGVMFLPGLVPVYGTSVLFLTLAAFSLVTLLMVPFLAEYPRKEIVSSSPQDAAPRVLWGLLTLALFGVFLFQAGNMALAAYMIELGRAYGLKLGFVSNWLGIAGWCGALGSLSVVFLETRLGRVMPLLIAFVLTVIGNAAFHYSASPLVFVVANIGTGMTWAFIIPYLLGMCAAFDASGQTAAMGGFFSKMGLATGPLAGSLLLNNVRYDLLINVSVAALAASALFALIPALALDRRAGK
jgi:DHA1 family inner membrane transport protein